MAGISSSQGSFISFLLAILTLVETADAFGKSAAISVLIVMVVAWVILSISTDRLYGVLYGETESMDESSR